MCQAMSGKIWRIAATVEIAFDHPWASLRALTGHLYFACYFRASCNNASRTALESGYGRKGNKGGGELPTRNRAQVLRSLHDVPWAEQMHRCAG